MFQRSSQLEHRRYVQSVSPLVPFGEVLNQVRQGASLLDPFLLNRVGFCPTDVGMVQDDAEFNVGPYHPSVATSLNNLALLYYAQGHYARAEPLYKRSLKINEKALGPDHPNVALSLNNLALLYDDQGYYAQAEPLYKRALKIDEKALGPDHPLPANAHIKPRSPDVSTKFGT